MVKFTVMNSSILHAAVINHLAAELQNKDFFFMLAYSDVGSELTKEHKAFSNLGT